VTVSEMFKANIGRKEDSVVWQHFYDKSTDKSCYGVSDCGAS